MANNSKRTLLLTQDDGVQTEVGSEVVLGTSGNWMISESTQTGGETDTVQITVPLEQLMQRIESFKALKRQQVDVGNQQQFYQTPKSKSEDGERCARTDMVYVRRSPSASSHIITHRIQNTSGPTPLPLSRLEELKQELAPPVLWQPQSSKVKSGNLLHLPERITTLERFLDMNTEGSTPKDLLQRVQHLERRLLQLESYSPEYSLAPQIPGAELMSSHSRRT